MSSQQSLPLGHRQQVSTTEPRPTSLSEEIRPKTLSPHTISPSDRVNRGHSPRDNHERGDHVPSSPEHGDAQFDREGSKQFSMQQLLNPEEVQDVLRHAFYSNESERETPAAKTKQRKKRKAKAPDHYKVLCISLYDEDVSKLDAVVDHLRAQGHRRVSRSMAVRAALEAFELPSE